MRILSITGYQLIDNIARIHEYYLEKSALNYYATTLSIALRQEIFERRLKNEPRYYLCYWVKPWF